MFFSPVKLFGSVIFSGGKIRGPGLKFTLFPLMDLEESSFSSVLF